MCLIRMIALTFAALLTAALSAPAARAEEAPKPVTDTVSYFKQIRPIFQANCQGCHQPAKDKGGYVMTDFTRLLKGGDSEDAAIVPGDPDKSYLVEMITPVDGVAEMPQKADPLHRAQIDLIRKWIAQGAVDDTPANAKERFDMDHPPVYTRPPVITSMDYSPDGKYLAVAGFHEVLLMSADGSKLEARLVGMSQRIASVRFSPDGTKLAVTGGRPSRMGEVQVWGVEKRSLLVSAPVTYDTVYGASWSPDGNIIAIACADNSVRAIDAKTGKQVFFNAAHNDWALDTVFSADGKYLVSVGRDMTTKLYEIGEERFVDNVTSITPGALKGGIPAVARHPKRDEIVIGGSDGQPKVYRMFRQTNRVIGDDANAIRKLPGMRGRVNAVAVSPDGATIAAGSSLDGQGQVFIYAYNFDGTLPDNIRGIVSKVVTSQNAQEKAALEQYLTDGIKVIAKIESPGAAVYTVAFSADGKTVAAAGGDGLVRLFSAADGGEVGAFSPAPVEKPADAIAHTAPKVDFIQDVTPVLSRLGCNAGTCHGAAAGRNGFKLSLRGYDPIFDVRALTDDHASRRVNLASPDDSLMLLKTTGAAPHEGGALVKKGDPYYNLIRDWIAGGAKLNLDSPRVVKIEITPATPILQHADDTQQMKVIATYADGSMRDVTDLAFVTSGNTEVAKASERGGVMTALRRGEAPVLARYEGAYTATMLTVMGDREGFTWKQPETWGRIDELTAAKWQRMKILPSDLCSDEEFIRRVYLDLTGVPPSADDVRAFIADTRDTRTKRDELVDKLIGSEDFVIYWTNKWADLLQVNSKFLGGQGARSFYDWIRQQVEANTPYNEFAKQILTADGSNRENPAASYYKVLREPDAIMENTTHLFLGVRFNCNKCHDHPFEKWTQDQYFQTAAYFARVGLKRDPAGGNSNIGGTAVEGAKPLYEIIYEKNEGEVLHDRTKGVAPPQFPFECDYDAPADATRRQQLAAWVTSPDNPYFARSYVNRLWGYLFGSGIMEPIDDLRAGNPPTNPPLLDHLTTQFIDGGFNVREMFRAICKSRTYQLSYKSNRWNVDDTLNYSHRIPKRLPAEALYDAVAKVTGSKTRLEGVAAGTRAAALPDSNLNAPGGLLDTLGRPARESACECDRKNDLHLGSVMAIISGPAIADAIADPGNDITNLVAQQKEDAALINELFMRILSRPATEREIELTLREMKMIEQDHGKIAAAHRALEAQFAPTLAAQEAARQGAIAQAKADLEAYEAQIAAQRRKMQEDRQALAAKLTEQVKAAEAGLPQRLADWERRRTQGVTWVALAPKSMSSTNGATLKKEDDGSIFVSGPHGKTAYEVIVETDATGLTGVRLELLADDRLPSKGPGRARNGNFVLGEFEVYAATRDKPDEFRKITLQNAQADFSQAGYNVADAIDGKVQDQNNGWATHPQVGQNRTATFEFKENVGSGGGAIIKFVMHQPYGDGQHALGRFRLTATNAARPLTLPTVGPVVSDWHHIGPFQAADFNQAFDRAFPPEKKVDLAATYQEGKLKWTPQPSWVDAQVHNVFTGENAANYIYRTITVPAPVQVPVSLGSDDGVKVFLNGKAVLANNIGRGAAPDQEKVTLALDAGVNHLLIKVNNGSGPSGFYYRADLKGVAIPGDVLAALDVPAEKRNEAQKEAVIKFYRNIDGELAAVESKLAEAKQPLPEDPGLKQRRDKLAAASTPIPIDPRLAELRRIAAESAKQLENSRLTIAQDLAWALINSPAFLFNH